MSTTDDTECTLSNILSGILYRFRVTAITKEGLSSFPSDPSEPFVIDIPGVQVKQKICFFSWNFKILCTKGKNSVKTHTAHTFVKIRTSRYVACATTFRVACGFIVCS